MGEEGDARAGGRGHVCVRVRGLSEDASSLISPAGSLTMRQDDFSPVVKKCARVGGGARKRNVLREAQASAGYQTGEPEEREYHHRGRVSTHREDNVEYKYVSNAQPSTRTEPIAVASNAQRTRALDVVEYDCLPLRATQVDRYNRYNRYALRRSTPRAVRPAARP